MRERIKPANWFRVVFSLFLSFLANVARAKPKPRNWTESIRGRGPLGRSVGRIRNGEGNNEVIGN